MKIINWLKALLNLGGMPHASDPAGGWDFNVPVIPESPKAPRNYRAPHAYRGTPARPHYPTKPARKGLLKGLRP